MSCVQLITGDPYIVVLLIAGDPYISFVNCHKGFLAEEGTLDTALYASVRLIAASSLL